MEITQDKQNDINLVTIKGRLDASTAGNLEETLGAFSEEQGVKILVNCADLEYISSAGLRVLLASAKTLKKNGGKIGLASLSANVKQVFEISGFTSIFPIYDSSEEAMDDLNA